MRMPRRLLLRSTLAAFLLFSSAIPAYADRIDIDDPSVLGSVLFSVNLGQSSFHEGWISEVRYGGGLFSYIYAIQSNGYFPTSFDSSHMVSFDMRGHPLNETWGAIRHTDPAWARFTEHEFIPSNAFPVASMTPVYDGFQVVPTRAPKGGFAVVYMQSFLPPSRDGMLFYRGEGNECHYNPEGEPVCEHVFGSFRREGFFAPVPEPASVVLLGVGLAILAARRRVSNHRVAGRTRRHTSTPQNWLGSDRKHSTNRQEPN